MPVSSDSRDDPEVHAEMPTIVRLERENDREAIRRVHRAAFAGHPHSRQTEHAIVDALREAGALSLSLVAEVGGEVVGHVAFSPGRLGAQEGWYVLGPIGVLPARQRRGVGVALVERGVDELRRREASGCALVGDPAYYRRFGFRRIAGVDCPGIPDEYVLCLVLRGHSGAGELHHHPAFAVEP